MNDFRISLGPASCDGFEFKNFFERHICNRILEKIENLKLLSADQIANLIEVETDSFEFQGKVFHISTIKILVAEETTLIAVRAFWRTLWLPTYFSLKGIGEVIVEGLIIKHGSSRPASSEELWNLR